MNNRDNHIDLTVDYDNFDNMSTELLSSAIYPDATDSLRSSSASFNMDFGAYNAEHYEQESDSDESTSSDSDPNLDSVVTSVIQKFAQRSRVGLEKYGTDLDREDLTFLDWVQHAQEEHMDAILYLEKIKKTEEARLASTSSERVVYLYVAVYVLGVACLVLGMGHILDHIPIGVV